MAQEIVIHVWCDNCRTREIRQEGQTYTIGLNGIALEMDLCDDCYKELVAPLQILWDRVGRPVQVSEPTKSPPNRQRLELLECPICRDGEVRWTRSNLKRHLIDVDAIEPSQAGSLLGYSGDNLKTCPECGSAFLGGPALTSHRNRIHDVQSNR